MRPEPLLILTSISLAAAAGCDALHSLHSDHTGQHGHAPSAPTSTFAPIEVTFAPTNAQLAAHFCPLVAAATPLDSAASAACRANGPAPAIDALATHLRVETTAASSNMVRLHVESVLLVLTVFPDTGAPEVVGSVCLTLCDEGASACPQTDEACRSTSHEVIDVADVDAARGFLVATAVQEQRVSELVVREIPPHGSLTFTTDLELGTERLLDAIQANDAQALDAIRGAQAPTFRVPYAIEGTLWVDGRGNDGFAEPITRATGTIEFPSS